MEQLEAQEQYPKDPAVLKTLRKVNLLRVVIRYRDAACANTSFHSFTGISLLKEGFMA